MRLDIRYAKTKELACLKAGETFLHNNSYFMVTDEGIAGNMKCVNLETGVICCISQDTRVIPVKLVVHRDEEE